MPVQARDNPLFSCCGEHPTRLAISQTGSHGRSGAVSARWLEQSGSQYCVPTRADLPPELKSSRTDFGGHSNIMSLWAQPGQGRDQERRACGDNGQRDGEIAAC